MFPISYSLHYIFLNVARYTTSIRKSSDYCSLSSCSALSSPTECNRFHFRIIFCKNVQFMEDLLCRFIKSCSNDETLLHSLANPSYYLQQNMPIILHSNGRVSQTYVSDSQKRTDFGVCLPLRPEHLKSSLNVNLLPSLCSVLYLHTYSSEFCSLCSFSSITAVIQA